MISQEFVCIGKPACSARGGGTGAGIELMRMTSGAAVLVTAALVAAPLGGCSTMTGTFGDPMLQPGKFQFLRCEDIAKRLVAAQSREQELHVLMDRAASGTGGTAINWFVYEPDLKGVEAELRALRVAAGEKRCSDEVVKAAPKADIPPVH
jgi:hypothetical protein